MTQAHAHRIEIERGVSRVRVTVDGVVVGDSDRAVLLHEGKLPTRYYLPPQDVRTDLLVESGKRTTCPWKGEASYRSLVLDGRTYEDIVWTYPDPIAGAEGIRGLLCFYNERVEIDLLSD